jgi:hypothetical protein
MELEVLHWKLKWKKQLQMELNLFILEIFGCNVVDALCASSSPWLGRPIENEIEGGNSDR